AAVDGGQRQGQALAAVVDVGGGVGVEVAGARAGLRAVDLQLGVQRQPVVGDQDQVDGHLLRPAEQPARRLHRQGAVQPPQAVAFGLERLEGGPADGVAAGGGGQRPAGGGQGAKPGAGGEQDVEQHRGGAGGAVVLQAQAGAQQLGGMPLYAGPVDGIVHGAQASAREQARALSPFSG